MNENIEITRSIVRQLAERNLDMQVVVDVSRDWLLKEEKAYIQVMQNKEFKFHILCQPTDEDLSLTEDLVCDVLAGLGYNISRKYIN